MENKVEVSRTKKIVNVPENAYIRADWQDYPENRTLETISRVKTYFSDKYGISKTAIKINFIPIINMCHIVPPVSMCFFQQNRNYV